MAKRGKVCVTDKDGVLTVSYEDYEVEFYDGADYEAVYTLHGKDREILKKNLVEEGYTGSFEKMIKERFGEYLEKESFARYLNRLDIDYDLNTWIS